MTEYTGVVCIISGGQTGADMGGLLAGRDLGLETGGWAPVRWQTERGPNPRLAEFGLMKHSGGYTERTPANVRDADGTAVFGDSSSPGSHQTVDSCRTQRRPFFRIPSVCVRSPELFAETLDAFRVWLVENEIRTLNVAGNRESIHPGIEQFTRGFLVSALLPDEAEPPPEPEPVRKRKAFHLPAAPVVR